MISQPDDRQKVISLALSYFNEGYACSQAVLMAYANHLDLDLRTAKLVSSAFGGGMGRLRKTCGALTGGFMVLGMAYGNEQADDQKAKQFVYSKVRDIYHRIETIHGTVICKELLQKHASQSEAEENKNHKIICRSIIADVAGLLYDELNQTTNR